MGTVKTFQERRMWSTLFHLKILFCIYGTVFSGLDRPISSSFTCNLQKDEVHHVGCLVKTCKSGLLHESLRRECSDLIEELVEKKLSEKGVDCLKESDGGDTKYKSPAIIVAGGGNHEFKLFRLDTKEVCNLPDTPYGFGDSYSMFLFDETPTLCSSNAFGTAKLRMKNETEARDYRLMASCIQLSPASKEAEWTIFSESLSKYGNRRKQLSLATPDGILLMGGPSSLNVDLLKKDGSYQTDLWRTKRYMAGSCGFEDEGSIVVTGGGSTMTDNQEEWATKIVERYGIQGIIETLPELNEARSRHGCGTMQYNGKKVFVVGGGFFGSHIKLSSTEMLSLGSTAWTIASPLPRAMMYFGYVSVNNNIYFLEALEDDQTREGNLLLLRFDGERWENFMQEEYKHHAIGTRVVGAVDLATSGFDDFCTYEIMLMKQVKQNKYNHEMTFLEIKSVIQLIKN